MSLSVHAVHSPVLAKRHFDEGEALEGYTGCDRQLGGKRSRLHHSPAAARCVQFAAGGLHAVPPTTLTALLALFPGMDERVVAGVLSECGSNIDAAIRRLGELQLSTRAAAEDAAAAGTGGHPHPHGQQQQQQQQQAGQLGQEAPSMAGQERSAGAGPSAPAPGGPATAEQWVEALVAEMSAAADLSDARVRAGAFLRQFEAFVSRYVRQQAPGGAPAPPSPSPASAAASAGPPPSPDPSGAAASGPASAASLAARASKLSEENAVLKRAVQIQHRQLQERAGQEGEVATLRAMLAQYQEQVRTLQVSNYSLSMHLQTATTSGFANGPRNPDVF